MVNNTYSLQSSKDLCKDHCYAQTDDSKNRFVGPISTIQEMFKLKFLDLRFKNFSGRIDLDPFLLNDNLTSHSKNLGNKNGNESVWFGFDKNQYRTQIF